jgi:GxxExxY protein
VQNAEAILPAAFICFFACMKISFDRKCEKIENRKLEQDVQDRRRQDMQDGVAQHIHSDLTEVILGCCFDIMNELGIGFIEKIYKNALFVAIKEKGLKIETEKRFKVMFRGCKIGVYIADLVVAESVIVEVKCCESLLGEHQAQLINYLKVSGILVGLLVNFGKRKVKFKRLHHPDYHAACDHAHLDFLS